MLMAHEVNRVSSMTRVLMLLDALREGVLVEALRLGVRGFLLSSQGTDDLVNAVRVVVRGDVYVAPVAARLPPSDARLLSPRCYQVLQLIAEGKTTKEVAALLKITFRTADYHRTQLMRALNIHDTAGLVRYAFRTGLLTP